MQNLEIKNIVNQNIDVNEEGEFEAIVSTENIDTLNDIVKVDGIKTMPNVKLLHEHLDNREIGIITSQYIKDNQYIIKGKIDLKNEIKSDVSLETRYALRKLAQQGKIGLSIGYIPTNFERKNNTRIINSLDLSEISFVKNPANLDTGFLSMKTENDSMFINGLNSLNNYYNELQKKNKLEKDIMYKNLSNIINTTTDLKEFKNALKNYPNKKPRHIINKTKKFIERCAQKKSNETQESVSPSEYLLKMKNNS